MVAEVNSISASSVRTFLAEESTIGVLPGSPQWFELDFLSYPDSFGPNLQLDSERVVNSRQRLLGDIVAEDVAAGGQISFKPTAVAHIMPAILLAQPLRQPQKGTGFDTGVSVVATGYDIGSDADAAGWEAGHLLFAEGFATSANNGLKTVTGTATNVVQVSGLTVESTPPAVAAIYAVGIQFGAGELDVVKAANTYPQLVIASGLLQWTDFAIEPGSRIFIGNLASGATANRFDTDGNNGWARVRSVISATALEIDSSDGGTDDTTDMSSETGTGKSIQIFLSDKFADVDDEADSRFDKVTYRMERRLGIPNPVGSPGVIQTEDILGATINTAVFGVNNRQKATVDLTMIGIGSEEHTGEAGDLRTTDGASIIDIPVSRFFNNSSHIVRSKLSIFQDANSGDAAPDPLINFATNFEVAYSNEAQALPAVGRAAGFDTQSGGFIADVNLTQYFRDLSSRRSIRANDRAQFELAWKRTVNGREMACFKDFPACTLGNGLNQVQIGGAIQSPIALQAAQSVEHGKATVIFSLFRFLPV